MRLAFVVYGSLDEISGGFIYDRALVDALRSLGHDVDVFGLPWRGYFHAVARSLVPGRPRRRPGAPAAPAQHAIYDAVIQDELIHPSVFRSNRDPGGWLRGRSTLALVHNLRSRQAGEALPGFKAWVELSGTPSARTSRCAERRQSPSRSWPATHPSQSRIGTCTWRPAEPRAMRSRCSKLGDRWATAPKN
jgi:hypothetical protein